MSNPEREPSAQQTGCVGPRSWFILAILMLAILSAPQSVRGQTVAVYYSSADGTYKLTRRPNLAFAPAGGSPATAIDIDSSKDYQTMLGIGTSMEDTSIYNLWRMGAATRHAALVSLFSPSEGIGLNAIRLALGTPDFTATSSFYSYDDMPRGKTDPTLAHFSIRKDIRNHIVSVVREALRINPNIRVFASVWSPPGWMKSNDSLIDGKMLDKNVDVYAVYLVKAIQAYRAEGIPIYAVSVQNEPNWCNNSYPQTLWTWEIERDEVNAVKAALSRAGLRTKVWIGDMDYIWWDRFDARILADPTAGPKVDGVAFHPYEGTPSDMTSLHNAWPHVPIYVTERGWRGIAMATNTIQIYRNWASLFANWVTVVDQKGGPALGPYKAIHGGLIEVNTRDYHKPAFPSGYYFLGQFSRFIRRGAVRIGSDPGSESTVTDVAFRNPGGQIVVVVENDTRSSESFRLLEGGRQITDRLPSETVGTYIWAPRS